MTINATASILLALYVAVARRQGGDIRKLSGTVQNDVLKEYIARGNYIYPPAGSMRLTTDLFAYCKAEIPRWNTISISGYHFREKGCSAVQEVAFTLSNGIAYVQAARVVGVKTQLGRQVKRHRQARRALGEQVPVALVGLLGRGVAGVLAHRPQLLAVHLAVHAAGERVLPGLAQALGQILADVILAVERLDLDPGVGEPAGVVRTDDRSDRAVLVGGGHLGHRGYPRPSG